MAEFILNDGGRAEAGFKGSTGDCVVRAIAIASGLPYLQVYNDLKALNKKHAETRRSRVAKTLKHKGSTPRNGNYKEVYHDYILSLGFKWVSTMGIGTGCKVHVHPHELPNGTLILQVSKHLTAFIDGVVHDTHNCSKDGKRCVYGYYHREKELTFGLDALMARDYDEYPADDEIEFDWDDTDNFDDPILQPQQKENEMALNIKDLDPQTINKLGLNNEIKKVSRSKPANSTRMSKDSCRSYALQCLGVLSKLTPAERKRVLEQAIKVNDI